MTINIEGRDYELVRASDLDRDGMMLEAWDETAQPPAQVLEIFYSDQTGVMSLTTFGEAQPLALVEYCIEQANLTLPPLKNEDAS